MPPADSLRRLDVDDDDDDDDVEDVDVGADDWVVDADDA